MDLRAKAFVTALSALLIGGVVGPASAANHAAAPEKAPAEKPTGGKAAKTTEKPRRHAGPIKAVDPAGRTLTVKEKSGEVTVTVPDKASIKRGKATVKLGDLKAGEAVTVMTVQRDGKEVARSVTVKAQ